MEGLLELLESSLQLLALHLLLGTCALAVVRLPARLGGGGLQRFLALRAACELDRQLAATGLCALELLPKRSERLLECLSLLGCGSPERAGLAELDLAALRSPAQRLELGRQLAGLELLRLHGDADVFELVVAALPLRAHALALPHQVRGGFLQGCGTRRQGVALTGERSRGLRRLLEPLAQLGGLAGEPPLGFLAGLVAGAQLDGAAAMILQIGTQALDFGGQHVTRGFGLFGALLELERAPAQALELRLRGLT